MLPDMALHLELSSQPADNTPSCEQQEMHTVRARSLMLLLLAGRS
jgi:hypothetical protein